MIPNCDEEERLVYNLYVCYLPPFASTRSANPDKILDSLHMYVQPLSICGD